MNKLAKRHIGITSLILASMALAVAFGRATDDCCGT